MDAPFDDTALLRQLAGGDPQAFWELWERHRGYVARLCRHWLNGRPDEVEDAVSDTMVYAFLRLPACAGEMRNLEAWLRQVTFGICARRWREQARCIPDTPRLENDDEAPASPVDEGPEELVVAREMRERLLLLAGELPPHLHEPFALSVCDGLRSREIALRLGISEESVRKRVQEARSRLRKGMHDYLRDGPPSEMGRAIGPPGQPLAPQTVQATWRAMVVTGDAPETERKVAETRVASVTLPSGAVVDFHIVLDERPPQRAIRERTLLDYIRQHPAGWKKRLELAELQYAAGRWDEAAAGYREVLARQPQMVDVAVRLGNLLRLTERHEDAAAVYESALRHARRPADAATIRGLLQLCRKHYGRAAECLRRAAALEPHNAAHWHALAWVHLQAEQPWEALRAYEEVLRLDPDDVAALVHSYLPLWHLGRRGEIERRLTHALEVCPNDVMALALLASQRAAAGRVRGREGQQTQRLIGRALHLAPDSADAASALAQFHLARGEWVQAVGVVRTFVALHPQSPRGWHGQAEILYRTGGYQAAADALLRALALCPRDFWVYRVAPHILGQAGRRKDLARTLDEMLRRFPNRWDACVVASTGLGRWLDKRREALDLSAEAVSLQPEIPQVWFWHAVSLSRVDCRRGALDAVQEGWQRSQNDEGREYALHGALEAARIDRALGHEAAAREWFERALACAREAAAAGDAALGCRYLGDAWEGLGDRRRAIQAYRGALARHVPYPGRAEVSQALERLGAPVIPSTPAPLQNVSQSPGVGDSL